LTGLAGANRRSAFLLLACAVLAAGESAPQAPLLEGPEATRPELPAFEAAPVEPSDLLPRIDIPRTPDTQGLAGGLRVRLSTVEFSGNRVLSDVELAELAAPYLGREVSIADLEALRDDITRAYVERGYVSSGAIIPEQSIRNGVLRIEVFEGGLAAIDVETDGRFRESYIRAQLDIGDRPVNVREIEEKLRLLQQDRRIRSVHAELEPSEIRGQAVLRVRIVEHPPWAARLFADNYRNPSIGAYQGTVEVEFPNVVGYADSFRTRYSRTEGANFLESVYKMHLPMLAEWGTSWDVHFRWSDANVVEAPFDRFDISSSLVTIGFTIAQPLYRSPRTRLTAFLTGDWRRSKTYLLDEPFSFSPGPHRGVATAAVLRGGLDLSVRTQHHAFSARTQISGGIDALAATINEGGIPDGQFLSWLTQAQYALRLPWLGVRLITRADVQLANSPLLTLEQFAIGGRYSVRGYRQNQVVGDNGAIGSVELRIPLWRPSENRPSLELAPFFDAGHSWNRDREGLEDFGPFTLLGAGIGASLSFREWLRAEIYWGTDLKKLDIPTAWDLQDTSIYFQVRGGFPR